MRSASLLLASILTVHAAPAARAQEAPPALLRLAERYENYLWLGSVLPCLERLARSERLAQICREPDTRSLLQRIGIPVDPAHFDRLLPLLKAVASSLPIELRAGVSEASVGTLARMMHASVLLNLAHEAGTGQVELARGYLREATDLVLDLPEPALRIEVLCSSEAVAIGWLEGIVDSPWWLDAKAITWTEEEDGWSMRWRAIQQLHIQLERLQTLGLAASDPDLQRDIARVRAAPPWTGRLRRVGTQLVLQLGTPPEPTRELPHGIVAMFGEEPPPLFVSHWSLASFVEQARRAEASLLREPSPARRQMIEPLLADARVRAQVDRFLLAIDNILIDRSFTLRIGEDALFARYELEADPDVDFDRFTIGSLGLTRFEMPGMLRNTLDAAAPLDEFLLEQVQLISEQMTSAAGGMAQKGSASFFTLQDIRAALDSRFDRLHEYLQAPDSALFRRGSALLVDPGARLTRLSHGTSFDFGPDFMARYPWRVPGLAVIGRPRHRRAGHEFANRCAAALRGSASTLASVDPAPERVDWLGIDCWSLAGGGGLEVDGAELELAAADLGLHYFFIGEFLVISTSRALSRRIVELPIPEAIDARVANSFLSMRMSCPDIADMVRQAGQMIEAFTLASLQLPFRPELDRSDGPLGIVERLFRLCGELKVTATIVQPTLRLDYRLELR